MKWTVVIVLMLSLAVYLIKKKKAAVPVSVSPKFVIGDFAGDLAKWKADELFVKVTTDSGYVINENGVKVPDMCKTEYYPLSCKYLSDNGGWNNLSSEQQKEYWRLNVLDNVNAGG